MGDVVAIKQEELGNNEDLLIVKVVKRPMPRLQLVGPDEAALLDFPPKTRVLYTKEGGGGEGTRTGSVKQIFVNRNSGKTYYAVELLEDSTKKTKTTILCKRNQLAAPQRPDNHTVSRGDCCRQRRRKRDPVKRNGGFQTKRLVKKETLGQGKTKRLVKKETLGQGKTTRLVKQETTVGIHKIKKEEVDKGGNPKRAVKHKWSKLSCRRGLKRQWRFDIPPPSSRKRPKQEFWRSVPE